MQEIARISGPVVLEVKFTGEEGTGDGVTRGWVEMFASALGESGLFYEPGLPQQAGFMSPVVRDDTASQFETVGKFIGLCLLNNQVIPLAFNRHVLKMLLDRPLHWHDLGFMDPVSFESMRHVLLHADPSTPHPFFTDLDMCFAYDARAEEGGGTVELLPGGADIKVTALNGGHFVHLYAASRLRAGLRAVQRMRTGLLTVVPDGLLRLLNAEDVWLLLNGGGAQANSAEKILNIIAYRETRKDTSDVAARPLSTFKEIFSSVITSMTDEQRGRFLYFATSWSRLPALPSESQGRIRVNVADNAASLPHSQSCFRDVTIPFYPTEDVFRAKLLSAIIHSIEFAVN